MSRSSAKFKARVRRERLVRIVLAAATALALALAIPTSLGQDTDAGELAYVGHDTVGETVDRIEVSGFVVENASHRIELRYNAQGVGRVEFRIVASANESTVLARAYDGAGAYSEQTVRWPAEAGSYRLELEFVGYNGTAETSVWDVTANSAAAAALAGNAGATTTSTTTTATGTTQGAAQTSAPSSAGGAPSWLTPALVVQTIGVLGTIGLGTYGIITVRRRQGRLAEHLDRIEKAFEETKQDHGACRDCMLALREEFKAEFRKQEIEERQFLLLESRINEYIGRLPPNN